MKTNKTNNIRKLALVIIVALSIALQACNPIETFRNKVVKPLQEYHHIDSTCGVIC